MREDNEKNKIDANGYYEQPSIKELLLDNPIAETIKRKTQKNADNSNDLLGEFSEQDNEFYVDEVKEKKQKKAKKETTISQQKRKPVSPIKRKAKRFASFFLIVAVLLVVAIVLSLTILFKCQAYEVTGATRYSQEEIVDKCGIGKGENLFLAPKVIASNRIKNAFPYVEEADVSMKIPDTITIKITEAEESYLVKISDTEYLVISSKGRILNKVETPDDYDLPIFLGPEATATEVGKFIKYEDEKILDIINEISTVFVDNGYQGITEIDASNSANISFTYEGRIKVLLGLPEDLSYKIRTAMTIIEEKIDINKTTKVEGELNVAKCKQTKKSYFSEASLMDLVVPQNEENTEETIAEDDGNNLSNAVEELFKDEEEKEAETQAKIPQEKWYID